MTDQAGQAEAATRTLAEAAYVTLRRDLLSGALPPGEPLRFADLRLRFGLSVGTLREALTRLAAEGLVVAEGQRGFRAGVLSLAELHDVTRLRILLETDALRESIALGGEAWEAEIVAAFHRLSRTPIPGEGAPDEEVEGWERRHSAFHRALVAACASPWIMRFRQILEDQSVRYRRVRLRSALPARVKRDVTREHKRIMEAALARDADRAVELIRTHLKRTEDAVASAFGAGREGQDSVQGQRTVGGIEERIDSTLPPVRRPKIVPRS